MEIKLIALSIFNLLMKFQIVFDYNLFILLIEIHVRTAMWVSVFGSYKYSERIIMALRGLANMSALGKVDTVGIAYA